MSWFGWGGSSTKESPNTSVNSDDHASSELKLHSGDSPSVSSGLGGFGFGSAPVSAPSSDAFPPTPVLALDQIKSAGVPLNRQMSPYLQIDPSMFANTKPQYIMPDGGNTGKGKFEFALGHIGWAVAGGYVVGCARGFIPEYFNPETKKLGMFSKPWMTRIVNATVKHGSGYAQPAGAVVFMYSVAEIAFRSVRADDDLNSLIAGTLSGAIYRSPHGLRASGIGAGVGLLLSAAWSLINVDSRQRIMYMLR